MLKWTCLFPLSPGKPFGTHVQLEDWIKIGLNWSVLKSIPSFGLFVRLEMTLFSKTFVAT